MMSLTMIPAPTADRRPKPRPAPERSRAGAERSQRPKRNELAAAPSEANVPGPREGKGLGGNKLAGTGEAKGRDKTNSRRRRAKPTGTREEMGDLSGLDRPPSRR